MSGASYGFIPAPGTDYTQGAEPVIAARLDALAKALHLNLTGISGYRTPKHSVEVGGFANDPHTRGLASDTPGIEAVPERTLELYGLTRPFGGASEADHIQPLQGFKGSSAFVDSSHLAAIPGAQTSVKAAIKSIPDSAANLAAQAVKDVLGGMWNSVKGDALRALLYVVFTLGGMTLAVYGLSRMLGPDNPIAQAARGARRGAEVAAIA
jgi:hypothetical protein